MVSKKKSKKYEDFRFPYETFPICIQHYDSDNFKICWFQCIDHMDKYIKRHKLKHADFIAKDVWGKDLNPVKPKRKRSVSKKTIPKTNKKDILTPTFSSIETFFKK